MNSLVARLDTRFYPQHSDHWDDWIFRKLIFHYLRKEFCILDLGAGSGFVQQMRFSGQATKVCGLDPDPSVLSNPHLDEARVGFGENVPWPDHVFDLVFADNVLEHLPDPEKVFREVFRVLKPEGYLLVKTPNRFHYVTLIAQLTPTSFHKLFNRLRGRSESDTFQTHYRANSKGKIELLAKSSGFLIQDLQRVEGRPEYLRFSALTYIFGIAYEKIVNRFAVLAPFRVLIMAALQKPSAPSGPAAPSA